MKLTKIATAIVVTGMTLSGCQSVSESEVNAAVAEATRDSLGKLSPTWTTAQSGPTQQLGVIAATQDPTLSALVAEAQENNRTLESAALRVEQAQSLAIQAGASLGPAVNLQGGSNRSGGLDSDGAAAGGNYSLGLQVSWEADLWGRISSGTSQAAASAQAAEADYRFAQHSIAANTAIAYFIAIETNVQKEAVEESRNILRDTNRIVSAQHREGIASASDLALSNADLASSEEQVVRLDGAYRSALRALELLVGRYPAADLELRRDLPAAPKAPAPGLTSEILEQRPDIVAAERRVAAAFNATNQAKAARLPSFGLTGTLGGSSSDLENILNPANLAWSLGTSLLAPIFDGGKRREDVNIATAEQELSLVDYAEVALQAFGDVENSLDQGVVLGQREVALQEALDQASKAYRLADLRYQEGEISLLDLLSLQQRVLSAKSNLVAVKRLILEQRINLELALGDDWQKH